MRLGIRGAFERTRFLPQLEKKKGGSTALPAADCDLPRSDATRCVRHVRAAVWNERATTMCMLLSVCGVLGANLPRVPEMR